MNIKNLYAQFLDEFLKVGTKISTVPHLDSDLKLLLKLAEEWSLDLENVYRWMKSPEYESASATAQEFAKQSRYLVDHIQGIFKVTLKGDLLLSPSLMRFDGFARYDSGHHKVIFGIDHPDADLSYLKVLLAHELSHVYRDHQPRIWEFMKKPLEHISRVEYLENFSAAEHLVSEGLATLFSQAVFPETPLHIHHYYTEEEMQWCILNEAEIEKALVATLKTKDEDVWKFYEPGAVKGESPSRIQYFWAAKKISEWLKDKPGHSFLAQMVWALSEPSSSFDCFKV